MYCVPPRREFSAHACFSSKNPTEARRARYSQFKGGPQELSLNGEMHFGYVVSVTALLGQSPDAWMVSINPAERPVIALRQRIVYVHD